ncbi:MAG: 4Fe-4S dicluster domain-containing protein [archaeon]|nr:4Fe-4S dicluster domain-containing protein [archaeon]
MSDYSITINQEKCTGCGSCVDACPSEVYDAPVNDKAVIARIDDCVGCEACVTECPEEAITVTEN